MFFTFTGWGGAGLGRTQQGISDPISGGEVRDKFDKYKVRVHCCFQQGLVVRKAGNAIPRIYLPELLEVWGWEREYGRTPLC